MITEQDLHEYNKWLMEVWNPNQLYIPFGIDAPRAYLTYKTKVKNLDIPRAINWVACSERKPDQDDIYYVYPYKYHYAAQYNKYGKWAGKWTNDDANGYEYEVYVDYWKVIEPPCS